MLIEPGAEFDLRAYLDHIGFSGAPAPDLATLRAVCALHPAAIPFENLTVLAGQPVRLDLAALQRKMTARTQAGLVRGGYCFEHNTLLAAALDAIGFPVTGLAARVIWNTPPDSPLPPQTHMVLGVRADGEDWLVDAGFGGNTLTAPLRMDADGPQQTPLETFRLTKLDGDRLLEVDLDGVWAPMFRLSPEPRAAADFALSNYWVSTHPDSHFRHTVIAARTFEGGRYALRNFSLSEYRTGRAPVQRTLSASETEAALADVFGLDIPDRDAVRRTLARAVPAPAA